jgi:hypothetical protein
MGDLELVFFQYVGRTPSLAGCAKCRLKFFTPQRLMKQPEAAAQYLREKFTKHTCKWEIFEQTRPGALPTRQLWIVKQTNDTSSLGICEACGMRFLAPVYLRAHADQADNEIRRQFGQHRCRRRKAG